MYAMKTYGIMSAGLHIFLTCHQIETNGDFHPSAALSPIIQRAIPIEYESGCATNMVYTIPGIGKSYDPAGNQTTTLDFQVASLLAIETVQSLVSLSQEKAFQIFFQ